MALTHKEPDDVRAMITSDPECFGIMIDPKIIPDEFVAIIKD